MRLLSTFAIVACASVAVFAPAFAADAPAGTSIREVCAADYVKFCAGQQPGSEASRACMRQHRNEVSEPCRTAMDARRAEMIAKIKASCSDDVAKFCSAGSSTGEGVGHCLRDHQAELSESCKAAFPNHHD